MRQPIFSRAGDKNLGSPPLRSQTPLGSIPGCPDSGEQPAELAGILDAALEIAEKRRGVLTRLYRALQARDTTEVVRVAKELCDYDEKSN
jgi:hypothetical protein